jgi:hypothetical protein
LALGSAFEGDEAGHGDAFQDLPGRQDKAGKACGVGLILVPRGPAGEGGEEPAVRLRGRDCEEDQGGAGGAESGGRRLNWSSRRWLHAGEIGDPSAPYPTADRSRRKPCPRKHCVAAGTEIRASYHAGARKRRASVATGRCEAAGGARPYPRFSAEAQQKSLLSKCSAIADGGVARSGDAARKSACATAPSICSHS